jgi:hypothetical protein
MKEKGTGSQFLEFILKRFANLCGNHRLCWWHYEIMSPRERCNLIWEFKESKKEK